jgi:hypothetical protein
MSPSDNGANQLTSARANTSRKQMQLALKEEAKVSNNDKTLFSTIRIYFKRTNLHFTDNYLFTYLSFIYLMRLMAQI